MVNNRIPPVSYSSTQQSPGINPTLQQWLNNIQQWQGQNWENNPGTNANGFAEVIAKFISDYAEKNPSASPDQVLKLIQQKFFTGTDANGHDVYFQSNASSVSELQGLIAQFTGISGKISLPPPTTMDTLLMGYKDALHNTQFNSLSRSKQDNAVLLAFINEIGKLGSNGKLSDLKSWAKDLINNNPNFKKASAQVQELFQEFSVNYKG